MKDSKATFKITRTKRKQAKRFRPTYLTQNLIKPTRHLRTRNMFRCVDFKLDLHITSWYEIKPTQHLSRKLHSDIIFRKIKMRPRAEYFTQNGAI